jgi:hypothetical protein
MSTTDRLYADWQNEKRAERRRWLYANDPVWRLTKNKDNWERRERARRMGPNCGLLREQVVGLVSA